MAAGTYGYDCGSPRWDSLLALQIAADDLVRLVQRVCRAELDPVGVRHALETVARWQVLDFTRVDHVDPPVREKERRDFYFPVCARCVGVRTTHRANATASLKYR